MKKRDSPVGHSKESVTCSSSEDEESSDTTDVDSSSSEDLKPLSTLIGNKTKILDEAFSVITLDKLKTMVPPFLQDASLEKLKVICYEELCKLTDEDVKSILKGDNLDDTTSQEEEEEDKETSCTEPCSHERSAANGFEFDKSEDTMGSNDSANRDFLEIDISEEEMTCLLKEIPNSQDTSKDFLGVKSPSPSAESIGAKISSDDLSANSLDMVEVDQQTLHEDSVDIMELEHRARSIRSLIVQCDDEEQHEMPGLVENVSKITGENVGIEPHEYSNIKESNVHTKNESVKHQEIDPLSLLDTQVSKVVVTSHNKERENLNCEDKLTADDRVGQNEIHGCADYTLIQDKIPGFTILGIGPNKNYAEEDNSSTIVCDDQQSTVQKPPYENSTTGTGSAFNNPSPLHITISALNKCPHKKNLKLISYAAEKVRENNIHKVVSTSKMCTKLRERIKRTQQLKKFKDCNTEAKTVILGTVEEYKSLNTK